MNLTSFDLGSLPDSIQSNPWLHAGILAAASWVSEDVAAIAAASLAAAAAMPAAIAFVGAFAGIWLGDLALYGLARWGGRRYLGSRPVRRWCPPERLEWARQWFQRRGAATLLLCRFLPGTRLPTYVAAGLAGMPASTFTVVTGFAALTWTLLVFAVVALLGAAATAWLHQWRTASLIVPLALIGWFAAPQVRFAVAQAIRSPRRIGFGERLTRWEFWPPWIFYSPVVAWYAWLSLRYRGATLPTAANPGIEHGGLVGESKIDTQSILHQHHPDFAAPIWRLPGSDATARIQSFDRLLAEQNLAYPVVLKPEYGQRGAGVKIIRNRIQALDYLNTTSASLLLQEYAPGPFEVGIFYVRRPGQTNGRILALTDKVFPEIRGDGRRTLEELIRQDPRARWLAPQYLQRFADRLMDIPPADEQIPLVQAGNHAQGCIFRNGWHLRTEALEARIDQISRDVPGFFVGRYDIRYRSIDDLQKGQGFTIVELNGAGAEATHIYDERCSLWDAYRSLFRQWAIVFEIGAANRREGTPSSSPIALWKDWRRVSRQAHALPAAD